MTQRYFLARDTGLYYLQSRYYDPATGRFLNADIYISTGQGLLGNNMFAYCNNNPVLYWDPEGTKLEIWNILFEVHDPGFIHRAVQDHIVLPRPEKCQVFRLYRFSDYQHSIDFRAKES